jgi:acyl-CoA thioester hydrolase
VNNANYLNYLEHGRYEFLKDIGFDYPGMVKAGYGVYIVRVEIDYKRSALPDDQLLIKTWPVKRKAVSGIFAQEIWRGEELLVEAKVTWAIVDSRGLPAKIPAEFDLPGLKPDQESY